MSYKGQQYKKQKRVICPGCFKEFSELHYKQHHRPACTPITFDRTEINKVINTYLQLHNELMELIGQHHNQHIRLLAKQKRSAIDPMKKVYKKIAAVTKALIKQTGDFRRQITTDGKVIRELRRKANLEKERINGTESNRTNATKI